MSNKLKTLLESLLDEETVKLEFPWKEWTLNKETAPTFMSMYRDRKDPLSKFRYEPGGIMAAKVSEEDGSGAWYTTDANTHGNNTPFNRGSIITLDFEHQRFFITTNLNDPRISYVVKSTVELFPELSNFKVSKIKWDYSNDKVDFEDYGTANELLSKIKTSKGVFSAYKNHDEEDRFEEFEFLVFKELNEETWYHATKESNVQSIMQKGLLTSHTFDQGTGWTELNFNLQNAVYLTSDLDYARQIAETLTVRFGENAAIISIAGKALQDFSKIVTDEDALRDDFQGIVHSFDKEGFTQYIERMPEVIDSVVADINSIGYKGRIDPQYLNVEEIMEAEFEEKPEDNLRESTKQRNTNNFLAVLNYKSKNNIKK